MTIIGIDPGLEGGITIIHMGELPIMHRMPVIDGIDEKAVREILADALLEARRKTLTETPIMAHIEKVSAMPKQGVCSMFTFGAGWGIVRGIMCGLEIPYQLITPQTWQKVILAGLDRRDTKAAAYQYVSRLYPQLDYRASERSHKPHSGKVDSLCIALYGRSLSKNG